MTLHNISHPLHAVVQEEMHVHPQSRVGARHFVTISRQAGVSGRAFAHLLVARMNELDSVPIPWTFWDRELVEKVAEDHHLTVQEVQALEDSGRSWLLGLLGNVSLNDKTSFHDEYVVYRRAAHTIRGLAMKGRVVIVGRGGAYVTQGLRGGIHVRLVAPLEYRVAAMAARLGVAAREAREIVRNLDRNREAFCRRYFDPDALAPETFTATFNAAALSPQQIVACIIPMLEVRESMAVTKGCHPCLQ